LGKEVSFKAVQKTVSVGAEVTSGAAECSRGGFQPPETHDRRKWTAVYVVSLAAWMTTTGDGGDWGDKWGSRPRSSDVESLGLRRLKAIFGSLGLVVTVSRLSLPRLGLGVSFWPCPRTLCLISASCAARGCREGRSQGPHYIKIYLFFYPFWGEGAKFGVGALLFWGDG